MTTPEALRAARLARGLTLREAAALLSTQHPNLAAIESGRREPSLEWLYDAAVALGVRPSELDVRLTGRRIKP